MQLYYDKNVKKTNLSNINKNVFKILNIICQIVVVHKKYTQIWGHTKKTSNPPLLTTFKLLPF